jgi:hypothetical protein
MNVVFSNSFRPGKATRQRAMIRDTIIRCPRALVALLRLLKGRSLTATEVDADLRAAGLLGYPALNVAAFDTDPKAGHRFALELLLSLSEGDQPLVERRDVGGIRDAVRWGLTRRGCRALDLARGALEYGT